MPLIDQVVSWAIHYENTAAFLFALCVAAIASYLSHRIRHPLQMQAVENDTFRAQREGYEGLLQRQAQHIEYLENKERLRDDYEAELVRLLRECQLARLQGPAQS